MTVNYKSIGLRIREFRMNKKLTQEKLAELTNLSVVHVSHIETANTNPSLSTLITLCNALQVTLDEVVCDSLIKSKDIYSAEMQKILADCDRETVKYLIDIVKAANAFLSERDKRILEQNRE